MLKLNIFISNELFISKPKQDDCHLFPYVGREYDRYIYKIYTQRIVEITIRENQNSRISNILENEARKGVILRDNI